MGPNGPGLKLGLGPEKQECERWCSQAIVFGGGEGHGFVWEQGEGLGTDLYLELLMLLSAWRKLWSLSKQLMRDPSGHSGVH